MYTAEQYNGDWYVCQDGKTLGTWYVGHMPRTEEECRDAAQRLNDGATIKDLPAYDKQEMNRIVARAWGDIYTAQDAEDGCIPFEAFEVDELKPVL